MDIGIEPDLQHQKGKFNLLETNQIWDDMGNLDEFGINNWGASNW